MASFKGYGRQEGQKRRQGQRKPRRQGLPRIEFLETRQLLTGVRRRPFPRRSGRRRTRTCSTPRTARWPTWAPARSAIYKAYVHSGGNTSQLAAEFPQIEFQNGMVGLAGQEPGG